VLFIFALIHFSTLYDGGNSEDLSNTGVFIFTSGVSAELLN